MSKKNGGEPGRVFQSSEAKFYGRRIIWCRCSGTFHSVLVRAVALTANHTRPWFIHRAGAAQTLGNAPWRCPAPILGPHWGPHPTPNTTALHSLLTELPPWARGQQGLVWVHNLLFEVKSYMLSACAQRCSATMAGFPATKQVRVGKWWATSSCKGGSDLLSHCAVMDSQQFPWSSWTYPWPFILTGYFKGLSENVQNVRGSIYRF